MPGPEDGPELDPDWRALAAVAADRTDKALVGLDARGRIVLWNSAMEHILGWRRAEVLRRDWIDACCPQNVRTVARRRLELALAGHQQRAAWPALTRDGRTLTLHVSFASAGQHESRGGVATVIDVVADPSPAMRDETEDAQICISIAEGEFGRIKRIVFGPAELTGAGVVGQPCFRTLHHRGEPCPGCPVLAPAAEPWPRVTVHPPMRQQGSYHAIVARPVDASTVLVSERYISEPERVGLLRARALTLAASAHLSERERRILEQLVLGLSAEDIARELGIAPRTVKFHQGNLLQKLGADSRHDLLRLLC